MNGYGSFSTLIFLSYEGKCIKTDCALNAHFETWMDFEGLLMSFVRSHVFILWSMCSISYGIRYIWQGTPPESQFQMYFLLSYLFIKVVVSRWVMMHSGFSKSIWLPGGASECISSRGASPCWLFNNVLSVVNCRKDLDDISLIILRVLVTEKMFLYGGSIECIVWWFLYGVWYPILLNLNTFSFYCPISC